MPEHTTPSDIERTSMQIISRELAEMGIVIPEENAPVVRRAIHTTADFDYAKNLRFTDGACHRAITYLLSGEGVIVSDTNMTRSGISSVAMKKLGAEAICYMAEPETAAGAKAQNTTRAVISMQMAAEQHPGCILAIGNAPTALLEICRLMEAQAFRPALVIAVPVGFVNVVEAKEQILEACERAGIPCIAAMGRKGGSTVAAAICNALLYQAADMQDPMKRGWN